MISSFLALYSFAAANAQVPDQDRYQRVGREVGQIYSSIGEMLSVNTADSAQLASAANQADYAVASLKDEIRTLDWSYLGPVAAKQQAENLQQYVNNLNGANAELHAKATQVAQQEYMDYFNAAKDRQGQYQTQRAAQAQNPNIAYAQAMTSVPKFQNKAVVMDESVTTTTASSTPTDAKESKSESKSESRESKSESKSAEREAKSRSKAERSESKSESRSAAAAAKTGSRNATNSTSSTPRATESAIDPKKSKNTAAIIGISGGAIMAAVFALL